MRIDLNEKTPGDDLVFQVSRRISDSQYEFSEALLDHLARKIEEAKPLDPIIKVNGGMLLMSVQEENVVKARESTEEELKNLKILFGKQMGAEDINKATQKLKMG